MKRILAFSFAVVGWFAIVMQYVVMAENRVIPLGEATIRFFSFFTILTNLLVAGYFSAEVFRTKHPETPNHRTGTLTALAVYITIVGLGYQILLRHLWSPTGWQWFVDELLHSVIPVFVIVYWYLYEPSVGMHFKRIVVLLLYPFIYLAYILLRGSLSGFYPYPFLNVAKLGLAQVLINSFLFALVFVLLAFIFVGLGRRRPVGKNNRPEPPIRISCGH